MTTPLETVKLEDGESVAYLAPGRGGMVTRFEVGSRPVLFLDEATLLDETKNVRGGVPVLFPSPGPLAGGRFDRDGRSGAMRQHGFARERAWSVEEAGRARPRAREVTLSLASDDATRAQFPWAFRASYRYALAGTTLRIEQRFENRGAAPMPFAAGFHPYFCVPDAEKSAARIPTGATRAWDNVAKREIALEPGAPIALAGREVDLHLVDHGAARAELVLGGGERVVVSGSPAFSRWVIWTLPGRDFVCLEPWTAPANALNTGESLMVVPPGEARELWTEIALVG
jgi:galactose mutarotase-like enzyme